MGYAISPIDSDLNRQYAKEEAGELKARLIDGRADEIAQEILSVDGFTFKNALYTASGVTERIYSNDRDGESLDNILRMIATSPVIWMKPCTNDIKTLMQEYAKQIAVELAEQEHEENGIYHSH